VKRNKGDCGNDHILVSMTSSSPPGNPQHLQDDPLSPRKRIKLSLMNDIEPSRVSTEIADDGKLEVVVGQTGGPPSSLRPSLTADGASSFADDADGSITLVTPESIIDLPPADPYSFKMTWSGNVYEFQMEGDDR
jgi:hypothetical protein